MEHQAASETISGSGIIVYLQEELTDARLRCEQLKRYIAEAVKLIQASEQRDHFHEVAGQLMHGIPDALFKLDKALSATALAASRLDYESLKQALKPEKVEELERVLEDARITKVKRRSNMGPKDVAAALNSMADILEATGDFPLADAVNVIASLEGKSTRNSRIARIASFTSSGKVPPVFIRSMAEAVVNFPNRARTAKILRELVANIVGSEELLSTLNQAGSREDVKDGFKKENPDLTDDQLEEIADQWEKNKDVVKDKNARFEQGKPADPTENMSEEDAAEWQRMNDEHGDKFKTANGKTAGDYTHRSWSSLFGSAVANFVGSCGETLYQYIKTLHGRLDGEPPYDFMGFTSWDYGNVSRKGDEWDIRVWGTENNAYPNGLEPNLRIMVAFEQGSVTVRLLMDNRTVLMNKKFNDGVTPADIGITCGEVWEKLLTKQIAYGSGETDHFAATAGCPCEVASDPVARFEEGKPADPTENMSDEDAEEWKRQTEEHKDEFKAAAWKV